MSTFGGKINEIFQISIDRFDGENVHSLAFFLSHCHYDHMRGLHAYSFQNKLLHYNQYLYASPVSCIILKKLYPKIKDNIKELCLKSANSIKTSDNKCVVVHLIPAGHCPGSVMFLFETDSSRILYTGDYRINPSDLRKFPQFYDAFNNQKVIDKIYLDTTFFLKEYSSFPSRQNSFDELNMLIKEWISKCDKNVIHLQTSARYGYEFVFNEIYKTFKIPVHVNQDTYSVYSLIPDMDKAVTTDVSITRIHAGHGYGCKICGKTDEKYIRKIKMSARRWTENDLELGLSSTSKERIHYVCYSTHASYEESIKFLEFFKSKDVVACVEYENVKQTKTMLKLLKEKVKEINAARGEDCSNRDIKLFDVRPKAKSNLSDSDNSLSDTWDSPPKKVGKIVNNLLDSP